MVTFGAYIIKMILSLLHWKEAFPDNLMDGSRQKNTLNISFGSVPLNISSYVLHTSVLL